jgi:hypothetical protein
MTWQARSFLYVSPDAVLTRHVQAVTGFSWGFTISQHDIALAPPAALPPDTWDSYLNLLRTDYPGWIFDNGYPSALSPCLVAPAMPRPAQHSSGQDEKGSRCRRRLEKFERR